MQDHTQSALSTGSGPPSTAARASAYCTRCGAGAAPSARFCGTCGNALERSTATAASATDDPALVALRAAQRTLEGGDAHEAIAALEALCVDAPSWPSARISLGIAYLRAGRVHDAQDALEAAERLAPDTFACQVAFAEFHARLGFFDRAVTYLDRALALPVPGPEALSATIELQRYCREHSKTLYYHRLALPAWPLRWHLRRRAPRADRSLTNETTRSITG